MVKNNLLLASLLCITPLAIGFDAESLRNRFENSEQKQLSSSERLKASQGNTKSLKLLNNNDIIYKLPNGIFVDGTLLPNGKVAPAYKSRGGQLYPACVTSSFSLVKGEWDNEKSAIACKLSPEELATIKDSQFSSQISVAQQTIASTNNQAPEAQLVKSNKYGGVKYSNSGNSVSSSPNINSTVSHASSADRSSNSQTPKRKIEPAKVINPNIYIPPARNNNTSKSISGVLVKDKSKFGIPIGTWIKGELLRPVSSAESGYIEFVLSEDIEGKYKTLPAGTIVFSNKNINEPDRRLESLSVTIRLPNDDEFPGVSMRVYSLNKTAGLEGSLIRDRVGELQSSGSNAALRTVAAITPQVSSVAGTAINSITNDMVSNEQRYLNNAPKAIIKVQPQQVLLKVSRAF